MGMNSNKISCQKYIFEQNEYNSLSILELTVKFASQIYHKNINKPLDGAYLANFGIDVIPYKVNGFWRVAVIVCDLYQISAKSAKKHFHNNKLRVVT